MGLRLITLFLIAGALVGWAVRGAAEPNTVASPPAGSLQKLPINEASGIVGRVVKGPDGHDIGRIIDVVVDQAGQPRAAVIDFGGFLGVGTRRIAVDWSMLHFSPGDLTVPVTLSLTPDQIKAAPEYRESAARPPAVVGQPATAVPAATQP